MTIANEWRWVLLVSLGIMLVATLPYMYGYAIAPPGYSFLGLTHNVDDALVYLSWMRQSADGEFFAENLFTTEPQIGRSFNALFYTLGRFAGLTHLPLIAVYHTARVIFGLGLLVTSYAFASLWIADIRSRRLALIVVGLSSGLGWLVPAGEGVNRSVDLWQPEAVTFLSIYLSPLFAFSLILILGSLWLLQLYAMSGKLRFAVGSGSLLLILGNVHSYDVIPVAIAWAFYVLATLPKRQISIRPLLGGMVAGLVASPSVVYQAYLYAREPVFRLRADVPTVSPAIWFYLLGFGLLVPLAFFGIWQLRRQGGDCRLLICWALAAMACAYLPVAFQRKLIMGVHIPLSILSAVGLATFVSWVKVRWSAGLTIGFVGVLALSNLWFVARDMKRITANEAHTTAHSPFVSSDERVALEWLRANSRPGDVVLAQPWLASLVPGYTGRPVYCGHWGETAEFEDKLRNALDFFEGSRGETFDAELIRQHGIAYIMDYGQITSREDRLNPLGIFPAFRSGVLTIYRMR